jgi:Domain of unknown function (DUF397)
MGLIMSVDQGWRKSSHSGTNGGCVELNRTRDMMRDSKNPDGPVLPVAALPAFVSQVQAGRFNNR